MTLKGHHQFLSSVMLFFLSAAVMSCGGSASLDGTSGPFSKAKSIAISAAFGEIYVIDQGNSNLYKLNREGKIIASVGGFGMDREALDAPVDLATDGMNVFVADRGNQRVAHFDRFLNFITTLQNATVSQEILTGSSAQQTLWRPIGVGLSPQGDLCILDEGQRQVFRINPFTFNVLERSRTALFTFGNYNAGIGILQEPYRIEVSKTGKVFVSDIQKRCLFVYDLFGNFVAELGLGLLKEPKSLGISTLRRFENHTLSAASCLGVVDRNEIIFFNADQATGFRIEGKLAESTLKQWLGEESLEDFCTTETHLYLLTPKRLHVIVSSELNLDR